MSKRAMEKHNFGRCSPGIQQLTKINIRGATDSHLAWTLIVTDGTLLHTEQEYYDRYSLCAGFFFSFYVRKCGFTHWTCCFVGLLRLIFVYLAPAQMNEREF